MQQYELRRGHQKNIEGPKLKSILFEVFGTAEEKDGALHASFGAIDSLKVWSDGKSLFLDTKMNTQVSDEVASQTVRAFNRFLEQATGYTAKERGRRAQKKAKEGKV